MKNTTTIGAIHLAGLTLLLSLGTLSAQQLNPTPAARTSAAKTTTSPQTSATTPNPGERKFQANCSRCHTAPEQISPRIAGTVVRHMRVRASLSAQDEQDILRFLAP